MAMLVGFHTEGWDHLILRALLAKMLGVEESEITPDWIDAPGRGWQFILRMVPKALRRFYGQCAQFAVVGVDNDGSIPLDQDGLREDPAHPRHWRHENAVNARCRFCQLQDLLQRTRKELSYVPRKPGYAWPVLIAVPVEAMEAWLIAARGLVQGRRHELRAENQPRGRLLKEQLYGRPAATREDVESIALPLIREMTNEHIDRLREYSTSFAMFAEQIREARDVILGHRDCWTEGNHAAER
jgi:hypothetical protein